MTQDPAHNDVLMVQQAIAEECEAFYMRDYDLWASYWLHNEDVQRFGIDANGNIVVQRGWHVEQPKMKQMMAEHPTPNLLACEQIRRENFVVHVAGNMAWATFDQITPRTDDVMVNVGLSHQIRIFEKQDGRWKIAVAAHADTRTNYLTVPSIHVDQHAKITWMNDSAADSLRTHPILVQSAGILRARHSADDKRLQERVKRVCAMTPMDVRPSIHAPPNARGKPLIFEEPTGSKLHLIWVNLVDGAVLVTFDDAASRHSRLSAAQSIYGLSDAQLNLARLIADGHDLPSAADMLGVSVNTARTHLTRMFDKVRVNSQTALVQALLCANLPVT